MSRKPKTITTRSIDKLLKFLPIFEQKGYEFSKWHSPKSSENGTAYFPSCEYSREVNDFIKTLYKERFIVFFNWSSWRYGKKLYKKPELLKKAEIETLQKLLTAHIRQERFCEGHLACVLKEGHITTILQRLKEIREKMKD